jgi:hypothetical protein
MAGRAEHDEEDGVADDPGLTHLPQKQGEGGSAEHVASQEALVRMQFGRYAVARIAMQAEWAGGSSLQALH